MLTESIEITEPKTQLTRRVAERFHSTPDQAAALYLDDLYISYSFPHVFFHRSPRGREVRVKGTGLMVWELVKLTRVFGGDVDAAAAHLEIEPVLVAEALRFADRYPEEVEKAIQSDETFTLDRMQSMLPNLEIFDVHATDHG